MAGKAKEPFHYRHRTFFVGLFIIIPLIAFPVFLVYTLIQADFTERWCHVYVVYDRGLGLSKGTSVTFRDMEIGHIKTVSFNESGFIEVELGIRERYVHFIKKDSKARLKQKTPIVGDWEIELTAGSEAAQTVSDGDILASETPLQFETSLQEVISMVEIVKNVLGKINTGEGTLGRLIMEDSLLDDVHHTIENANVLIARVEKTLGKTNDLMATIGSVGERGSQAIDSIMAVTGQADHLLSDATLLINDTRAVMNDIPFLLDDLQDDIEHADLILRSLRSNWLIKRGIKKQPDPLLFE